LVPHEVILLKGIGYSILKNKNMKGLVILVVLLMAGVLSAQNSTETFSEPSTILFLPSEKGFWTEEGGPWHSIAAQESDHDLPFPWALAKNLENSLSVASQTKMILPEKRLSDLRMEEEVCKHTSVNWKELSQSEMGPWQLAEVTLSMELDSTYIQLKTDAALKEILLMDLSGEILKSWEKNQDCYWLGDVPKGAYLLEIGFKYHGSKRTWLCRL
jgi:hypothetical protein